MTGLLLFVRPTVLAVIVGLFDLSVGELFKFWATNAWKGKRRALLHRQRYLRFNTKSRRLLSFSTFVLFVQIILLLTCVWWELSINDSRFPTSQLIPLRCFRTKRENRAIGKDGPLTSEMNNSMLTEYSREVGCENSLMAEALSGADILSGYPTCLPVFEEKVLDVTLKIQGSAVAFVANSEAGDPTIAYGLEEDGKFVGLDIEEDLTTTSFWAIELGNMDKNNAFWPFHDPAERVVSNLALPWDMLTDIPEKFEADSSASINCKSNSLDCYLESAKAALSVKKPIHRSYSSEVVSTFISSHRYLNSSICILNDSETKVNVTWVHLNQSIPDVEREGRSGPVPTRISIHGSGKCIPNMSNNSARLYFDAMEAVRVVPAMEKIEGDDVFERTRQVLQKAAIAMGMKTPVDRTESCNVYKAINGSSIGKVETYVSISLISIIVLMILVSIIIFVVEKINCPMKQDPYNLICVMNALYWAQKGKQISQQQHSIVDAKQHPSEEDDNGTDESCEDVPSPACAQGTNSSNSDQPPSSFIVFLDDLDESLRVCAPEDYVT